jgi:threonine synthase
MSSSASKKYYKGLIDNYSQYLPALKNQKIISLHEGNTPLIKLNNIPDLIKTDTQIYVKYEGLNPTGSFKDRGMTTAVTNAVHKGANAIICASTGNTSASAAAYAARAGIKAFVVIPEGKIATGKLAQSVILNAVIVQIKGNFDQGMAMVKDIADSMPIELVNSVNPFRLQGQKTAAFEIIEALGDAPDYHYLPVGNAGNITAHWMGYCEFSGIKSCTSTIINDEVNLEKKATKRPIMVGYQASGSAPFIANKFIDNPETIATAIRIGYPQSWDYAWQVQKDSGGWFDKLGDDEIVKTQQFLAANEGVFCEPASAISLAGAISDIKSGKIKNGSTVVCTLTGNGLKDPDTATKAWNEDMIISVDANLSAIQDKLEKLL